MYQLISETIQSTRKGEERQREREREVMLGYLKKEKMLHKLTTNLLMEQQCGG
jgi:hypothetical protein